MIKPVCPCYASILSACRSPGPKYGQRDTRVLRQTGHGLGCWLHHFQRNQPAPAPARSPDLMAGRGGSVTASSASASLTILEASGSFPPSICLCYRVMGVIKFGYFYRLPRLQYTGVCTHTRPFCFNLVLAFPTPHQVTSNKWPNKCIQIVL